MGFSESSYYHSLTILKEISLQEIVSSSRKQKNTLLKIKGHAVGNKITRGLKIFRVEKFIIHT